MCHTITSHRRFTHEFIIFAVKGKTARRISTRSAKDIWEIVRISGNKTIHPTEKPVELMDRIVKNSSEEGELIVDLFSGSGPAGEAAIKNNRNLIAYEVDRTWYNVSKDRFNKLKINM